jgi:L,D-peptidoglycan transpeptidase YkuD (ErfK/YbiS/YcfS/YnhG family)
LRHVGEHAPYRPIAAKDLRLHVNFIASSDGRMDVGGRVIRCALGRGGVKPAADKREGDGATPAGIWPIRRVLWRPDRGPPPATAFDLRPIGRQDGWCDDPQDPAYNRQVVLPYAASAEALWLESAIYDIVVVLGHNDDPVTPGLGSAIFLHLTQPDYAPTAGCVAIPRPELEALLAIARPGDAVEIRL